MSLTIENSGWVWRYTCSQVAQFTEKQQQKSRKKRREKSFGCLPKRKTVRLYFQDKWNILDCVCVVVFIIGYTLRWIPATYDYGRFCLSINCMCFIWRFLQAFTLSKTIGPMLYMMFKMVGIHQTTISSTWPKFHTARLNIWKEGECFVER